MSTPSAPFTSDAEHLQSALLDLDARLLLRVAQVRQIAGGDPERRGLTLENDAVIDHFERIPGAPLWAGSPIHGGLEALVAEIADKREALAAREAATRAAGGVLRLDLLADRLGLDASDRELLLLALAPEIDIRYERLFGWLHDDVERRRPSVQLALDLLAGELGERLALRERLVDPAAPLRRLGLLRLAPARARGASTRDELVVSPGALRWLSGASAIDPALSGWLAEIDGSPPAEDELADAAADLAERLAASSAGAAIVDLAGPPAPAASASPSPSPPARLGRGAPWWSTAPGRPPSTPRTSAPSSRRSPSPPASTVASSAGAAPTRSRTRAPAMASASRPSPPPSAPAGSTCSFGHGRRSPRSAPGQRGSAAASASPSSPPARPAGARSGARNCPRSRATISRRSPTPSG
ncbi:MAG: hypothetical protein H6711_17935 [Myxococcales bacterium]|nr:hypothetical protein [Myxococcales bacterium]